MARTGNRKYLGETIQSDEVLSTEKREIYLPLCSRGVETRGILVYVPVTKVRYNVDRLLTFINNKCIVIKIIYFKSTIYELC